MTNANPCLVLKIDRPPPHSGVLKRKPHAVFKEEFKVGKLPFLVF